jgi:general secretion pathway protein K
VTARRGFVLIAALWLLIALGAVGLDVSLRSRARRLAAANLIDETRARLAADAGTEFARSRLTSAMLGKADELRADAQKRATTQAARDRAGRMDMQTLFRQSDPTTDPWREPEELVDPTYVLSDVPINLDVRDTGAALNPNEADEDMLRQFLGSGLQLDYNVADKLTQAILDWRDQDDLPRVNGAEREEYEKAGAAVLPANRPFAEISELRNVLGMTNEIYEKMRPYITTVSSGRININSAPEPVLNALPGFTSSTAAAVMRLRGGTALPRNLAELRAMLPSALVAGITANQQEFNRRSAFTTDEIEISAFVDLPGSPISARSRVVVSRATTGAVVVWRKTE